MRILYIICNWYEKSARNKWQKKSTSNTFIGYVIRSKLPGMRAMEHWVLLINDNTVLKWCIHRMYRNLGVTEGSCCVYPIV